MRNKCIVDNAFIEDTGFVQIKEWLVEHCNCEENQIYFKNLMPTFDLDKICYELYQTEELLKSLFKKDILIDTKVKNISKSMLSLGVEGDFIDINNLSEIRTMLYYHIQLKKYFKNKKSKTWINITPDTKKTDLIIDEINKIIDKNSNIKPNASRELKKIYQSIQRLEFQIESKISYELNKYIKLGYLRDNKTVFRSGKILLPVNTSNKNKVKGIIDSFSSTGQTCFIQPISILELNNKMNQLISDKNKEIIKILIQLTSNISLKKDYLNEIYSLIKYYDIHYTIANLAIITDSQKPDFGNKIILEKSRNPLFTLNKKKYTPLDISIENQKKAIIISGPNSGGKTVVIKSIGLYSIMAQCGLYIPAKKANLQIFKSFLSDIGDKQSLNDDLSTFSAHMKKISNILNVSDKHSLIIIDEMGTGTDPEVGASLSISILNKLIVSGALSLCTTHLVPLKIWADEHPNASNASMEFDNKKIKPTFIFHMGIPGSSYGIEIAERMGIDKKIIKNASLNLNKESFKMDNLIKQINSKEIELTEKINDFKRKHKKLEEEKVIANQTKINLEKEKKEIKREKLSESKKYILSYRKEIENLIENIKRTNADKLSIKKTKKFIEETLKNISDEESQNIKTDHQFSIGSHVQIRGISESGIIIDINKKSKKMTIEIDGKKITSKASELIPRNSNIKKPTKYIVNSKIELLQSSRLDLRGKRVDEAIIALDKFLDKAILSNLKIIDILHGKGTGALQDAIHTHLKNIKFIKNFNFAPIEQGGAGITIVEIS